jgi:hypothetical protein
MFHKTQCTQTFPTTLIASGSSIIKTRDFVPSGVSEIFKGILRFLFLYPYFWGIVPPFSNAELVKIMLYYIKKSLKVKFF